MSQGPPERRSPAERVLVFPEDYSMGSLMVRPWGSPIGARWQYLGAARWRSLIPRGCEVRLTVDPVEADRGLTPLGCLPADALAELVLLDCPIDDVAVDSVAGLSALRVLDLFWTGVTDEACRIVGDLSGLEWLSLTRTRVGDDGVRHLGRLRQLRRLSLKHTDVTDCSLPVLAGLASLEWLSLTGDFVTNAGVQALVEAVSLRKLSVAGTLVDSDGISELRSVRPDIEIIVH